MTNLVFRTLTGQQQVVDNRPPAALQSLIERIVRKKLRLPGTIAEVKEAFIDNFGFISTSAALVKLEQRKYTNERGKMKECCRQYVEAGIKLDPFIASNQS